MATDTKTAKLNAGGLIPNFRLPAVNRNGQFGPADYKQHRNLVLIFFRYLDAVIFVTDRLTLDSSDQ